MALESEMSTPPIPSRSVAQFTFTMWAQTVTWLHHGEVNYYESTDAIKVEGTAAETQVHTEGVWVTVVVRQ